MSENISPGWAGSRRLARVASHDRPVEGRHHKDRCSALCGAVQQDKCAVERNHRRSRALSAFDGPAALPSSLSKNIVSGLLRDELGFKGLSMTDDLMMGAVTQSRTPLRPR